ncbi:hypothetical protein NSA24_05915 [Clostridioides mangenotii]|uniref:hypothetical protein n=1 Tax=Metaclostridioides mangenotii TaxID=1540 RepID=UPI002149A15A|nr:hypothetical protein [Clostridioides mangenotii]MCR1954370.1 hypothetical protein [Clostridioides mangenotii]
MKEVLIKNAYINSFDIDDKIIKDILIINTKSLVDDKTQRCVYIDESRLKGELIYYRYYGEKILKSNILNILLPLILANTNIKKSEVQVIDLMTKYVSYFKADDMYFNYLLSSVMYNSLIHMLIEDKNIEYKDLLQKMKEEIIGFNFELEKKDIVKFQMARIDAIKTLDDYIDLKHYDYDENILKGLLNVLYDVYVEDRDLEDQGLMSIKKSILSLLGKDIKENSIDNLVFVSSMSDYLIKIRNYRVSKKIFNKSVDPRYIINLKEEELVSDPVFNQMKVVSKKLVEDALNIVINCKSGNYVLKFMKLK